MEPSAPPDPEESPPLQAESPASARPAVTVVTATRVMNGRMGVETFPRFRHGACRNVNEFEGRFRGDAAPLLLE